MMSDENNLDGALTLLSLHRGLRARVYFRVQESAGDSSISARRELRPESARDGRRNETMSHAAWSPQAGVSSAIIPL